MKQFKIFIEVNEEKTIHKASGELTKGMINMMIGEMELIKLRLLQDLENSLKEAEKG